MADPVWPIESFNIYWVPKYKSEYPTVFGVAES